MQAHKLNVRFVSTVNSIRDEGAVALAECLSVNNTLQTISLGGAPLCLVGNLTATHVSAVNGIRDAGARALLEALKQNNAVRTLWLHGVREADFKSMVISGVAGGSANIFFASQHS